MEQSIDKLENFNFEDLKNENGEYYWWASDLMKFLGYKDMNTFQKAIDRAIKTCMSVGIKHQELFIYSQRIINGVNIDDYKLKRFACYLTVMNSDPKKELVAKAQIYFIDQTRKFELFLKNNEQIERLIIRDEIKEGNKSLSKIAKQSGIEDFARFNNAGYLGLYNMMNFDLAQKRGINRKDLFEYMGRSELAANLFRITQTEEKIRNENLKGQEKLEKAHYSVGKQVRDIVIKNTGKTPENLPQEKKLPELRSDIKRGYKNMLKADKSKKKK
ncbi:MAG: damage-inducible protein [Ignavibacteria bacterium]|nr:damage-inducible protein [Ignavibacteria bacterium]